MPIDTQLTSLFCLIDDFCTDISDNIEQYMLASGKIKRLRQSKIHASEVITLLLWFHLALSTKQCFILAQVAEILRLFILPGQNPFYPPTFQIYPAIVDLLS